MLKIMAEVMVRIPYPRWLRGFLSERYINIVRLLCNDSCIWSMLSISVSWMFIMVHVHMVGRPIETLELYFILLWQYFLLSLKYMLVVGNYIWECKWEQEFYVKNSKRKKIKREREREREREIIHYITNDYNELCRVILWLPSIGFRSLVKK